MKFFIILITSIFLFVSNSNAQLYQDWKWLHQSPQGNELRWVKMWDANTIYAIGAKGTFIKTTDMGATWTFHHKAGRMSGIPLQRADLRNAWFFNQNTGIVVGTYGSIFRTTDAGLTFDSVPGNPVPTSTTITGISFINNLTGYVVAGLTNYRLMKTTDSGLNWNAASGTPPFSNPFDVYAFNENKILVLNSLGDVCITTNGGVLWNTYAIGSQVNFYKAVFTDANTGYACGDWGRCRYTTNGGFNWNNMSGALFDRPIHSFDLKVRNNAVYMTGSSGYIWRSTNLGVTWDSLEFIPSSSPVVWSNSYYSSDFSVTGDTIITVGAHGSIYQTLGSVNKIMLSQYFKTGNLHDIWVNTTTETILAVGAPSSTASPITHDQILRSSNGGINWAVISPSPTSTAEFYSIEMIDANTGFICGSKSAVYKTINGGANWDSVVIPNMPQNLILSKVDFVNAQIGWIFSRYLTGTDTTIFKTTNGGINWFKQKFGTATGSENTINAACMLDENNGWLINNKPRPWKTTNGGISWDSTALGDNYLAGSLYDIKMLNPLTGYCVGSNNRVYKTTNGGATPWSNVSFSSTTIITLYALEVLNPLECIVLGTYGTVYYTSNGGSSWQNLNLGSSIDDINGSYLTTDGKLYTVTLLNSCIFKNSNMFPVSIGNENQKVPDNFELMQNYPNPFNPETNIKFTLPKASMVSLIIYDISGKEVIKLIDEVNISAGTTTKTFYGNNLSSGLYFCSLIVNGKNSSSMKMIILK
ncbi:MAG TPA: YCF48-related protein [Ignavibacteria bacterium]